MISLLNPQDTKKSSTISRTTANVLDFEDYISVFQDGFFNHALRLLGQERIFRYLGVYPNEGLPNSLLTIRNQLAGQTPPIHRIPVEILGEIFTHYTYSVRHVEDKIPLLSAGPACDGNPFILGQVCGLWRHIVLAMPTLWQSLCVDSPTPGSVHLVELWLQRARECPLTIQLFENFDSPRHAREVMHAIILLVIRRIRQWKHISFRISRYHQHILATLPAGHAMSLQYAEVDTSSWNYHNGDSMWRALHSSPALTYVEWGHVYREIDRMPDHIPWAQLTRINLSMTPNDVSTLHVLKKCKNLTVLEIWGLSSSSASPHDSPLALPNLRTLYIRSHDDPGHFLQGLVLPNLISLSINHSSGGPGIIPHRDSRSFRIFLEQSKCCLERFNFTDGDIDENNLMEYLSCPSLTSLNELRIRATLTDLTISSLTIVKETCQLLPNLKTIDFSVCRTTPGTFSDMVASRLPSLECVDVSFCPKFNDHIHDRTILRVIRQSSNINIARGL
ncbi:hypothetical protein BDZ94DRAFT_191694 [Collybia nuda]|uniref:F-box domain-containing protein n=1 Tax=Collybia nuda TaxID=64659 RepID=A0A9P6CD36_9AGAR|nr:hypothetical protein BDZ94DRAFT_191694 [Collybia nuda]